jgi:hypothetical protein
MKAHGAKLFRKRHQAIAVLVEQTTINMTLDVKGRLIWSKEVCSRD